ncbi:MAG: adenylosuccinate synthetase [Phaeodactylibacter sp.]|nr:adenylosuccinate synthetase [Phaeodactylibacter sp.]
MSTQIIIGLGYGDEGKGLATDYFCRQANYPVVVRFSGGHQAGHTVVSPEGHRHVFSSIGAGTFAGAPTFWSRYCTFSPPAFLKEHGVLARLGYPPKVFVDALTPVTTPYDIAYNQLLERSQKHGSCGVGFGATVGRHDETPYRLYVQDLSYPEVTRQKLKAIAHYYERKANGLLNSTDLESEAEAWQNLLKQVLPLIHIIQEPLFFQRYSGADFIFEGSQGVLLDMDHGFFPNVTRARTTSRNAQAIIRRNALPEPEIFCTTRAYQTRHGNGYLSNENSQPGTTQNPNETNQENEWQGPLRQSTLDVDMLRYALQCESNYSVRQKRHLFITCLDQLQGPLEATLGGTLHSYQQPAILARLLKKVTGQVFESRSDDGQEVRSTFQMQKAMVE